VAYLSLYRKYRSQTFSDLIGQEHVVKTLQNGVSSDRIAHSYLFTGPRGTGKTSSARLLAKCLCCEKGPSPEPCNVCDICIAITEGSCIDVVEMDAASQTGVEDVRETIIQVIDYMPAMCRFKVFIIDEVHDLSPKAFDALLKTIEEPPAHMIFVLATTEYNKVPPTIRSRCQKFEFHRASLHDLSSRLRQVAVGENVQVDDGAIHVIARMADGGFRDALTLLEQIIISSENSHITEKDVYDQLGLITEQTSDKLLEAIASLDVRGVAEVLEEMTRVGRDPRSVIESLLYRLADLTRVSFGMQVGLEADATRQATSHELAAKLGQDRLLSIRGSLSEAHKTIRDITLPRLWLESELIRIAQQCQPTAAVAPAKVAHKPVEVAHVAAAPMVEAKKPEVSKEPVETAVVETRVPTPEPTGDPNRDKGAGIWQEALSTLPHNTQIFLQLSDSRVASFEGNKLVVEMDRKINLDWMLQSDKPQRLAHILTQVQKIAGENIRLELKLGTSQARKTESSAVELPAEGHKLAQMAREVFGS
jgi:DNA polymerase-3 subunit gamma/tau